MKTISLLLIIVGCPFLLLACQSQAEQMTLLDDVSSVSVSKSDGYGGISGKHVKTINKDTLTTTFQQVLENAKGRKQNVDVYQGRPDYDLVVHYENGGTHLLHLTIGNKGEKSRVMYTGHEHNGFDLSVEDTALLRGMLENNSDR
ncbi:hypothetical protein [Gracilibacillus phocaeensis]|nr:hypothetical protein [Gracilibacillus phocaeensis]